MNQVFFVPASLAFRVFLVAVALLWPARSALAVKLVVMNGETHTTNSAIPPGEQVVTFGIEIDQSDLIGAGTNPVLSVHNLTFAGQGIVVPINNGTSSVSNKVDVQNVQTSIIDDAALNAGAPPLQSDLTGAQQTAVYADSWWYNSPTGVLQGVTDGIGDVGDLTDPAWQIGPIKFVGTIGYTWTPGGLAGVQAGATALAALSSPSGTNATTGQYMIYSGTYGPSGANSLTSFPLANQFINVNGGFLVVPLVQIVTTGDLWFPGDYSNAAGVLPGSPGSGTYIELAGAGVQNGPTGNGTYNLMGGNPDYSIAVNDIDNPVWYDFRSGRFITNPEPGSLMLAGLGALGFLLYSSRRKRAAQA